MKRKFLILTLCFTLIFTSISYKKTYADGGIISLPVLAVVSTLAVGTGIVLNNIDDVYDIGRIFYDYVQRHNEITWDVIEATFATAIVVKDKILLNNNILDICKDFFDDTFKDRIVDVQFPFKCSVPFISSYDDILPYVSKHYDITADTIKACSDFSLNGLKFVYKKFTNDYYYYDMYIGDKILANLSFYTNILRDYSLLTLIAAPINEKNNTFYLGFNGYNPSKNQKTLISYAYYSTLSQLMTALGGFGTLPYQGGYDWDSNVEDKKTGTGDLPLPIPGNLGDLVGKNPSDVWDNNYEGGLVGSGDLSIPNISNPSISIDGSVSFPNTGVENPPVDIPGVENPPIGGIIPSFPSFGDSLDFSPMYLTNINEKFPFSLPWDIGRLINKFDIEPKAPVFKVPIVTSEIELDLTIFDEWANIARFFVLIGFALSLILISTKLLG